MLIAFGHTFLIFFLLLFSPFLLFRYFKLLACGVMMSTGYIVHGIWYLTHRNRHSDASNETMALLSKPTPIQERKTFPEKLEDSSDV